MAQLALARVTDSAIDTRQPPLLNRAKVETRNIIRDGLL
jgi:hypothetical protein